MTRTIEDESMDEAILALQAEAPPIKTDIDETLRQRGKTHGEYSDHARVTQALKQYMHDQPNWPALSYHERETLDMIAHKIGRILTGDPHFHDHWVDIAGYAKLSADRNTPPQCGR